MILLKLNNYINRKFFLTAELLGWPRPARPGVGSGVRLVSTTYAAVAATLYLFPLKHGQKIEGAV